MCHGDVTSLTVMTLAYGSNPLMVRWRARSLRDLLSLTSDTRGISTNRNMNRRKDTSQDLVKGIGKEKGHLRGRIFGDRFGQHRPRRRKLSPDEDIE